MNNRTTRNAAGWTGVAMIGALIVAGCSQAETAPNEAAAPAVIAKSAGRVTEADDGFGHQLREVPADGAPTVAVAVMADPKAGYNVHLTTAYWTWSPQDAGREAVGNEGHAHIYVDDKKISRVYGDWFYLSADSVPTTGATVTVTLNANDHLTFGVDGEPIAAVDQAGAPQTEAAGGNDEHSH